MDDFEFSSNLLYENLRILKQSYPFIQTGSIGKSIMGKDIPFVRVGRGQKEVFYSASYHANEWITSLVLLEFLYDYCNAIQTNSTIWNFDARRLFDSVSIYIVPLVNPDRSWFSYWRSSHYISFIQTSRKNCLWLCNNSFPWWMEGQYSRRWPQSSVSCWLATSSRNKIRARLHSVLLLVILLDMVLLQNQKL